MPLLHMIKAASVNLVYSKIRSLIMIGSLIEMFSVGLPLGGGLLSQRASRSFSRKARRRGGTSMFTSLREFMTTSHSSLGFGVRHY